MAQVIGYFEDNVTFIEGPFVICNPCSNGWRIEVEQMGCLCPVLPDVSIYPLIEKLGLIGKTFDRSKAEAVCDALNALVKKEKIILIDNTWIY